MRVPDDITLMWTDDKCVFSVAMSDMNVKHVLVFSVGETWFVFPFLASSTARVVLASITT
jgi:hypothetical protein